MTTWIVLGSVTLPAVPESAGEARRFAADLLPHGEQTDIVILLISEAATNSLTHSDSRKGGEFTVILFDVGGGSVRTEVIDDGGPTAPARQECTELSVTGRGVALIEDLAVRSGWFNDDRGLLHTWFEVDPTV